MHTIHQPVLLREVLSFLNPRPNQNFIDCTFGGGGHALAILEKIKPEGKLVGIDWDPDAINRSLAQKNNNNLILINENYRQLLEIIARVKHEFSIDQINGILLDLGLSSDQLSSESRGFSFQSQGSLDLRFNPESGSRTAAEILNQSREEELFKIFKEYGGEPLARPIARAVVKARQEGKKIETADMLVQLVSQIYRRRFRHRSRRQPATRVFQALRIAVNQEWENLNEVLPQAVDLLSPGGRLAVITFHSGEDRLVKKFFKAAAALTSPPIKIITKKPIIASNAERKINPRSRSAKLRVVEKI